MNNLVIRNAQSADCARILDLMKELAIFEGYDESFKVGLSDLKYCLLEQTNIGVLVATVDNRVEGILVYFFQPYTYDLCPWLVIKELYISSEHRSLGLGGQLFENVKKIGLENKCSKIKWEVLTDNIEAQKFYYRHGARIESDWRIMSIDL